MNMAHCPYCAEIFKTKGLNQHIRMKHPDKLADWKEVNGRTPEPPKKNMTLIEKEFEIRKARIPTPKRPKKDDPPTISDEIPQTRIRKAYIGPPIPSWGERRRQQKQAKREAKASLKSSRMDEKTRRKYERVEEKTKEQFFSERHPQAFQYGKTFLPRLHTFGLLLTILYFAIIELMKGNYTFPMDWYRGSYILPAMVEIFSSQQALDFWWNNYGPIFIVIMLIIITVLVVFYLTIWRVFFKNYYKRSENSVTYEGRCYWRTNNSVTEWWDRHYHSPKRTAVRYWLKVGWWPPLNLFSPTNSLICIETSPEEKCEHRGIYTMIVSEKPNRTKVWNVDRLYRTSDQRYQSGPIPVDYVDDEFKERSEILIQNTSNLSFGNADTRNQVMRGGLRLLTPGIKEAMLNERKQPKNNN